MVRDMLKVVTTAKEAGKRIPVLKLTQTTQNVSFPNTSEVMARSQHGTINSGIGSVNFLGNVKHGNDLISGAKGAASNEFNGIDGHWDLNKKLENGKSAFVIRKR